MRVLLAAVVVLAARPAAAADLPPAADAARDKYQTLLTEAREAFDADVRAAQSVLALKLDDLIEAEKAKGNLTGVQVAQAEKERVGKGRPPGKDAPPPAIKTMRTSHDAKLLAARTAFDKAAKAALAGYLADLDEVVKDETKAGRVDAAVAIRDARKAAEKAGPLAPSAVAAPSGAEAVVVDPTPSPPPMPGVVKPSAGPGPAFSWAKAATTPARVKVVDIQPVPLDPKAADPVFARVPDKFAGKAFAYGKPKDKYNGVADVTVTEAGFLFVACNYATQGNKSGDWYKERWTAEQFVRNGWQRLDEKDMGGPFGKHTGDAFPVFVKYVHAGERMKLRCNKYTPPYLIAFGNVPGK